MAASDEQRQESLADKHPSQDEAQPQTHAVEKSVTLSYEADLCGSIEQALKGLQGYGVMALELIQNADDAGARTLCFDITEEGLIVTNDAEFSSCGLTSRRCPWERSGDPDGIHRPCNFHAISRMGSRSKIPAIDQIGRFGIGFVSVYQITDTPIVRSAGTELRLNPLSGEAVSNSVERKEGTEFRLAWASSSSDIRNALNASPTPPDVAKRVISETCDVLQSSLLFLRHIENVVVRENDKVRATAHIRRNGSEVTLTFGPMRREENWLLFSRDADDVIEERDLLEDYEALEKLHRSTRVSVAIPVDTDSTEGFLYAYLPTQQKTGMPLHINADFFPHASRQDIVLRGEGHERYWNEALLATAASIIGENFIVLRDRIGHERLWRLGADAFNIRQGGVFAEFWDRFSSAAKENDSVWTTAKAWQPPNAMHIGSETLSQEEQSALGNLGLHLLHSDLRQYWTALSSVGVRELRLSTIVTTLEALKGSETSPENPHMRALWSVIAKYIDAAKKVTGFDPLLKRLKAAIFLIDIDAQSTSPDAVWQMPAGVSPTAVRQFAPECPIVHRDILQFAPIIELVDEYTIEDFADDLAQAVPDAEEAEKLLGSRGEKVRALYELLTSFPTDPSMAGVGQTLSSTPFLWSPQGFVSPERGKLPGGFKDPTGYFGFLDTSLFPPGMETFAKEVLAVDVLSFHEYIDNHIETVLGSGLAREEYQELLEQIVDHRHQLEEEGSLELLATRAFLKTREGEFSRPDQCYFWCAPLETIFGNDSPFWVDETWMPPGKKGARLRDLLESSLGMRTTASARHIVDRIKEIAEEGTPDEVAEEATPILRHIINKWARFEPEDLEILEELQNVEFLPAVIDEKRDSETLYLPEDVFRASRARGFESQVPVIDIAPLRQASRSTTALLDLLGVPEEPDTQVIVDHLLHCISSGNPPSDLTYAMLNERVEKGDDSAAIEDLRDTAFIYDAQLKRFVKADQVFWLKPPFGDYWREASPRMASQEALFSLLGVRNAPEASNYAALMLEIAAKHGRTDTEILIHSRCLGRLAEALEANDAGADAAIDQISGEASLINLNGETLWAEDAIWIDSPQLAAPFGSALSNIEIQTPNVNRNAAARLFRQLGVRPVSEVVRLRLTTEPDRAPADDATQKLRDRADLLLWLAPDPLSCLELRQILSSLEIQLSTALKVQAEMEEFDPPVRSPISDAPAFLEREANALHIRGPSLRLNEWAVAFRAVFSEIERICPLADVKPLVMASAMIMSSDTREEAEEALRSSDFQPPEDEPDDIPAGEQLSDAPEEETESAQDDGGDDSIGGMEDDCEEFGEAEFESSGEQDPPNASGTGEHEAQGSSDTPQSSEAQRRTGAGSVDTHDVGHQDNEYKSKAGTGEFGSDAEGEDEPSPRQHQAGGGGSTEAGRRDKRPVTRRTERKPRTSRMISYVARAGDREKDGSNGDIEGSEISQAIDIAAIKAALKYEEKRGAKAEEQPHGNPGYDIVSISANGTRRLIEVKGLENDWTERGIKLSQVQYGMAEQYREEYWIYVVENARDPERQRVHAINNPFGKVEEYWFDNHWSDTAEESISARELNIRVGAKVRHHIWGTGTIYEVEKKGIALRAKVDFGFEGKKYLPVNSSLKIVD